MPRLNKLEEIDFPVTVHPVYVITGKSDSEKRILVRDKKALINDNNQRVLGYGLGSLAHRAGSAVACGSAWSPCVW